MAAMSCCPAYFWHLASAAISACSLLSNQRRPRTCPFKSKDVSPATPAKTSIQTAQESTPTAYSRHVRQWSFPPSPLYRQTLEKKRHTKMPNSKHAGEYLQLNEKNITKFEKGTQKEQLLTNRKITCRRREYPKVTTRQPKKKIKDCIKSRTTSDWKKI